MTVFHYQLLNKAWMYTMASSEIVQWVHNCHCFSTHSSRAQLWSLSSNQWKLETKNRETGTIKENDLRYTYNFMFPPLSQNLSSHSSIGSVQVKLESSVQISNSNHHRNLDLLQMWWWATNISCPWLWGDGPCASSIPVLLHSCDIHSEELQLPNHKFIYSLR